MKERVSALLDGALDDDASPRLFESIKRDAGLRRGLGSYCLIGDVLRDENGLSADFTRQGDGEPLTASRRCWRRSGGSVSSGLVRHLMPIAASVMGVAAVGWVAMTPTVPAPRCSAWPVQAPASRGEWRRPWSG